MKLKSILILTMVAILAMTGGAMAATTTTLGQGNGQGGASFGHTFTMFGCSGALLGSIGPGATTACTSALMWTAAGATALVTNSNAATDGTGAGGTFPAAVAYSTVTGQYTSGAAGSPDAASGYMLDQNLYGMCATNLGTSCNRFIPLTAVTAAAAGTAKIAAAIGATIPVGTDNFNQGTFITGLVSGFSEAAGINAVNADALSQRTTHHASPANGASVADGDYIDQRLAVSVSSDLNLGTNQSNLNQQFRMASGSSGGVVNNLAATALDPTWVGNIDPFTNTTGNMNGGEIRQQVSDNMANVVGNYDIGSYGQNFNNSDTFLNAPTPSTVTSPAAAGTAYNLITNGITGVTP